jgi:hypothetical protein
VDIVGGPEFSPEDVHDVKWDSINHVLANDVNWTDEDARWEKTSISINVPFQRRRGATSRAAGITQEYVVTDFYHRNIVSVIQEQLSDPTNHDVFNYEPYELKFQPGGSSNPIRVHRELYTSQAFIDAHLALQDQPPEPNCSLPRCIIALMFASDATQLTSFGDAKLWPLYLFFGNESKYRRCKPSCNSGHHIAYFHGVRNVSLIVVCQPMSRPSRSCLIRSKTLPCSKQAAKRRQASRL